MISHQETIRKVRIDMNESKFNDDHTKCVKTTEGDLKIDHDANLIDIEGDPLEDFKMKLNENLIDHSSCTLAWTENWEDTAEDNIELDKVLNKKCLRSGNHY